MKDSKKPIIKLKDDMEDDCTCEMNDEILDWISKNIKTIHPYSHIPGYQAEYITKKKPHNTKPNGIKERVDGKKT